MVVMKNISQTNEYISMDCYKEGREENHFFITINAETNELVENTLSEMNMYVYHAIAKVLELKELGALPKEALSVWY
ncbi:MAG: hypothetical protein IJZ82_02295 [Lachnospiraceae bacterium]|nr:hypothetical protein [Lachnospiraceae bacterium]